MFKLLTITIGLVALTACSPLEPITPFDVREADVEPASTPTNAEGGVCSAEPCDPIPNDTPNDVGGVPAGECNTPGVGGCPGGEPPVIGVATEPVCEEGGVPITVDEGGRDC